MEPELSLCATCRLFDLHSFDKDFTGHRGYRWQRILDGAEAGCCFCSLLKGYFRTFFRDYDHPEKAFIHFTLDRGLGQRLEDGTDERTSRNERHLRASVDEESIVGLPSDGEVGIGLLNMRGPYHIATDPQEEVLQGTASLSGSSASPREHGSQSERNTASDSIRAVAAGGPLGVRGICAQAGTRMAIGPREGFPEHESGAYLSVVADPETRAAQSADVVGRLPLNYHSDWSVEHYTESLKQSISACVKHKTCNKRFSGLPLPKPRHRALPTRCLEISGSQLFLRSTYPANGKYVTLSHRWNQDTERTKTTSTNVDARLQGSWDCELPKVFTDTLALASGLGVKYVWIDSLCIIQSGDQGRDWACEAPKMGAYYSGSFLNVMSIASTEHRGLYPKRSHSVRQFARLPYRTAGGRQDGHFFVYRPRLTVDEMFESSVTASTLASRAWVFQEQQLSRRTVHFTRHGMIFRCCTLCSIGYDEHDIPKNDDSDAVSLDGWYRDYLSTYTGLQLTMPDKDRLIALSGVMNEYLLKLTTQSDQSVDDARPPDTGNAENDMWMKCGHWWTDLHRSLLWQLDIPSTAELQRLPRYCSWSWASMLGRVSWEGMALPNDSSLIELHRTVEAETGDEEAQKLHERHDTTRCEINAAGDVLVPAQHGESNDMPLGLYMTGQLVPVLVRRPVGNLEEAETIARLSNSWSAGGLDDTAVRAKNWRSVCLAQDLIEICGWASIEHADFQDDSAFVSGPVIYALLMLQAPNLDYRHAHGNVLRGTQTYTVLYLQSTVGGLRYERIGVGRLFGLSVDEAYRKSQKRQLILV